MIESENIQNWHIVEVKEIEDNLVVLLKSKVSSNGQTLVLAKDFSRVYYAD